MHPDPNDPVPSPQKQEIVLKEGNILIVKEKSLEVDEKVVAASATVEKTAAPVAKTAAPVGKPESPVGKSELPVEESCSDTDDCPFQKKDKVEAVICTEDEEEIGTKIHEEVSNISVKPTTKTSDDDCVSVCPGEKVEEEIKEEVNKKEQVQHKKKCKKKQQDEDELCFSLCF